MKTKPFFKDFISQIPQNKATILSQISNLYVNKALRTFFNNINIYKLKVNQIFGIIFKIRFEDDSIKSISTMIRADRTSFTKLTTLFKHLLNLRMNIYKYNKANQIIFSYHIFYEDYIDTKLTDDQKKKIITKNNFTYINIDNNINYMTHNNLFKLPFNYGAEEYNSEEIKTTSIIFSYHIYSPEYNLNDIDSDLLLLSNEEKALGKQNKDHIKYKEDSETKIKYMNPLKLFKLPLSFAGSHKFHLDFKNLNKTTSEEKILDDYMIKYLMTFKDISPTEVEIIISLQEDPSIVIYKFRDRLILLPKLNSSEIIFERTIMSKSKEIYIIDYLNKQILLIKKFNVHKAKGFLKPIKMILV